ncbi:MAG: stage II sporulation protein M [Candidatus Altiarchaeota archaeon]
MSEELERFCSSNRILNGVCENRLLLMIAFTFMASGFVSGFVSYSSIRSVVPSLVSDAYSGIYSESQFSTLLNVFLRNIWATLIVVVSGVTILLPAGIIFVNGFVIALVSCLAHERGIGYGNVFLGMFFHGIFEVPALLLSAALGFRMGVSILKSSPQGRFNEFKKSVRDSGFIYLTVVLPLLLIAAVIEVFLSAKLV